MRVYAIVLDDIPIMGVGTHNKGFYGLDYYQISPNSRHGCIYF